MIGQRHPRKGTPATRRHLRAKRNLCVCVCGPLKTGQPPTRCSTNALDPKRCECALDRNLHDSSAESMMTTIPAHANKRSPASGLPCGKQAATPALSRKNHGISFSVSNLPRGEGMRRAGQITKAIAQGLLNGRLRAMPGLRTQGSRPHLLIMLTATTVVGSLSVMSTSRPLPARAPSLQKCPSRRAIGSTARTWAATAL